MKPSIKKIEIANPNLFRWPWLVAIPGRLDVMCSSWPMALGVVRDYYLAKNG